MKRFIALYFLYLGILYILFYLPNSPLAGLINEVQTEFTLLFLEVFLEPTQLEGRDILVNSQYKILITDACNGLIALVFFYASILAYPSRIGLKLFWLIWGYILLFLTNALRILWVVFITERGRGQEDFYWSHDIVGNMLLMSVGLGLFIVFIKQSRKSSLAKG
jgi:exosortase/archaeosortase family protein